MKVPYHKQFPSSEYAPVFPGQPLHVPLLTIAIRYKQKKHKLLALVDSGADACLFPRDVAEVLGINLRSGPCASLTGIGGNRVPFYFHEVEILFSQYHIRTLAGFAKEGIGAAGLLGQKGFFDQFIVSFDNKSNYFEVKEPGLLSRLKTTLHIGNN